MEVINWTWHTKNRPTNTLGTQNAGSRQFTYFMYLLNWCVNANEDEYKRRKTHKRRESSGLQNNKMTSFRRLLCAGFCFLREKCSQCSVLSEEKEGELPKWIVSWSSEIVAFISPFHHFPLTHFVFAGAFTHGGCTFFCVWLISKSDFRGKKKSGRREW